MDIIAQYTSALLLNLYIRMPVYKPTDLLVSLVLIALGILYPTFILPVVWIAAFSFLFTRTYTRGEMVYSVCMTLSVYATLFAVSYFFPMALRTAYMYLIPLLVSALLLGCSFRFSFVCAFLTSSIIGMTMFTQTSREWI